MKLAVDRLRWGLAAAVVLLLGGLVALVGFGRYRAARLWADILRKNGITVTHDSDNVTWSQAVKGHTVYTIRAKKAVQIADGKYTLHGVTILFYGKNANTVDRVQGDEFQYDQKQGVAKADGEVHIDIQAPGALTREKREATAPPARVGTEADLDQDKNVIHVVTSGLVYVQKLGVAATDRHVEFHYGGITCVSKGAEFDTNGNVLHLLADVVMNGDLHGSPAVVHATRADLDREKNTIAALQPLVESRGESARAANALLLLKADGSLQHASAWGAVLLQSPTRRVGAQRMEAVFAAQNQPQSAVLSGGVTLEGSSAKPMHGTASEADLVFTPAGAVSGVTAKGGVRLLSSVQRADLAGAAGTPALGRELRGDQVVARFRPVNGGKQTVLEQVHAVGGALARGESFATAKPGAKTTPGTVASGITSTQVAADDLLADFAAPAVRRGAKPEEPEMRHLVGQGHTRLQKTDLNDAEEDSRADSLDAVFAPSGSAANTSPPARKASLEAGHPGAGQGSGSLRLVSAVQTGHVQIHDQARNQGGKQGAVSTARGDRAAFDGATNRLTLTGGAAYQQEGTSLSADTIGVEQGSGNADAQGHVQASLAPAAENAQRDAERDATHVLADRARLMRAAQTAEFFGTDARPARMWQGGSQVLAANLYLDDAHKTLSARPATAGAMVEAVFAAQPQAGGAKPTGVAGNDRPEAGKQERVRQEPGRRGRSAAGPGGSSAVGEAVHVSCPALNYSGERHEAVCTGSVRVREGEMQVHAQQGVMFLSEAPAGAAADRAPTPTVATESSQGDSAKAGAGTIAMGNGGTIAMGGSLDRAVFSGNVRLDEPGRSGDGEQLVYSAKDGSYVLTGAPGKMARVADAVQGMVTGPALLLRSGEKTVIVNSTAASNGHEAGRGAGGRVHTELNVRPQER